MGGEIYSSRSKKRCIIYIRVSSERQVEGFSIDGQRRYLTQWAEAEGMTVTGVYVEPGRSGKSISGREVFQQMLDDVATGAVKTDFVLVFKLSRFGRNAKDVLNSLAFLMRYNVHLLSKEDGLDSSTAMGRMMITILGAVAEMERENIMAQTMLGREEKARQGGWNGGPPPYGYDLIDGKLVVNQEEAKIVKYCFETYVNGGVGYSTIVSNLNRMGVTRKTAHRDFTDWEVQQVKRMLKNPVYTGRIAYGKSRQQHIEGTDTDYRRVPVEADEYIMSDDVAHEPIVSDELFEQAQIKLRDMSIAMAPQIGRAPKYILSGILRCPMCGQAMTATLSSCKDRTGERKDYRYYICGHAAKSRNGQCQKNAISKERVETEVIEYTKMLVRNPQFLADIEAQVGRQVDVGEIDMEIANCQKRLKQLERSKANLEGDIDAIFDEDDFAERKRQDLNKRLNRLYGEIYSMEQQLADCEQRKSAAEMKNLTQENIKQMLYSFDRVFDQMNDEEKRMVIKSLISEIHLRPKEEWKKGSNPIKEIIYTFPVDDTAQIFGCNSSNVCWAV